MWKRTTLGVSCKMYQPKTISVKEMEDDAAYPVFGANGVIGRYREYNHEEPQLLITCRGATCGSVNISLPKSWITGNAMVIQPKTSEISNRYLEYLFRGGVDLSTAITGSAQPQITRKSLEPIEFFYPPLAEQKRIVERLNKAFAEIDKAIATAEAKEGEIDRLKASTLSAMLNCEDWSIAKLDEVAKPVGGNGFPKKYQHSKDGTIPFFKVRDMNTQGNEVHMNLAENYVTADILKEINARAYPVGTIIFPKIGGAISTNKKRILVEPSAFDNNIMGLIPNEVISPEYLFKVFLSLDLYELSNKAHLPSITGSAIKGINLKLPPLSEQKRIVERLDKAFAEIESVSAKTQSSVENYSALKAAILKRELTQSEAV